LRQWRWMPIAVFLIGMLSIIQIQWVDQISEKMRIDDGLVITVMSVQINIALYIFGWRRLSMDIL